MPLFPKLSLSKPLNWSPPPCKLSSSKQSIVGAGGSQSLIMMKFGDGEVLNGGNQGWSWEWLVPPSRHTEIDDQGKTLKDQNLRNQGNLWNVKIESVKTKSKEKLFTKPGDGLSPAPCFLDLQDQIAQQSHKALGEGFQHQEWGICISCINWKMSNFNLVVWSK